MKLFFRESGQGQPLIILHGLFGSSDNWYSHAKTFAPFFKVYLVDQRNHGQSPHSEEFNYKALTLDLEEFIKEHAIENPVILGHSMGGKTAMNFAVKNPDKLDKLIVVDIVPKYYPVHHDQILEGLEAIDLKAVQSRNEADKILSNYVPEPDVRQFLLKNLSRNENGFEWKINIAGIDKNIEQIGAGLEYPGTYDGPSLFIKGAKSNYYKPGDEETIKKIFTQAKIETIDTGHWVQAENPQEFSKMVLSFLGK
jgi:pimeloyl-ACP methyl ester carboxylesterase